MEEEGDDATQVCFTVEVFVGLLKGKAEVERARALELALEVGFSEEERWDGLRQGDTSHEEVCWSPTTIPS